MTREDASSDSRLFLEGRPTLYPASRTPTVLQAENAFESAARGEIVDGASPGMSRPSRVLGSARNESSRRREEGMEGGAVEDRWRIRSVGVTGKPGRAGAWYNAVNRIVGLAFS